MTEMPSSSRITAAISANETAGETSTMVQGLPSNSRVSPFMVLPKGRMLNQHKFASQLLDARLK